MLLPAATQLSLARGAPKFFLSFVTLQLRGKNFPWSNPF
jgi:hypothetical protein